MRRVENYVIKRFILIGHSAEVMYSIWVNVFPARIGAAMADVHLLSPAICEQAAVIRFVEPHHSTTATSIQNLLTHHSELKSKSIDSISSSYPWANIRNASEPFDAQLCRGDCLKVS